MKVQLTNKKLFGDMIKALQKAVAMYDLLHAHARGETDLTEEQLGNAVTGISREARRVLVRARGAGTAPVPVWRREAVRGASQVRPRRRLH